MWLKVRLLKRSERERLPKLKENSKLIKQRHISNWGKELSILAETGTLTDNGKLNRMKREIFKKYRVSNTKEVARLTDIEGESASKSPKHQKV
jgi:hypothetical protein